VQIGANVTGLNVGTYTGHITVSASGASGSPATITVTLTITAALPVSHSVALSWNASTSSDVVGYNAYRATIKGGPYGLIASAISGTAYTDLSVQSGVTYYYVMTATNSGGQESVNSNEATAIVP
jgi:fibronectin type 3 domain-containing protein